MVERHPVKMMVRGSSPLGGALRFTQCKHFGVELGRLDYSIGLY